MAANKRLFINVSFIFLLTAALACHGPAKISNPVLTQDFPDPTVIRVGATYYAYATNSKSSGSYHHIQLTTSTDLNHWTTVTDALPQGAGWAKSDFWAPHVLYDNALKKYVMFYSAQTKKPGLGKCLGVAFADQPQGPFEDMGQPLIEGPTYRNIDPCAIIDPQSGRKLLFWGSAHEPIVVQEMSADWKSFKDGSEARPVIQPAVEKDYDKLVEGGWVDYHDGYYYLYYSGDNCCGPRAHYAVMVARSKSATGPYERLGESNGTHTSVILGKDSTWTAPGHNSVFQDVRGHSYIAYHAILNDHSKPGRVFLIKPLKYKNGWPVVQ